MPQQRGLVTHVTMRNTGKHNAFNAVMSAELVDALSQAEQARSRAVILRAEPGVKVWSAGHDISELPVIYGFNNGGLRDGTLLY